MLSVGEDKLSKEELGLISACLLGQLEAASQIPTFMDIKLMKAKDDLRCRLVALNSKICEMMPEDEE